MKTKNAFTWKHGISLWDVVPAGSPVHCIDAGTPHERYYVNVSVFPRNSMAAHDATYYGCGVDKENIEF